MTLFVVLVPTDESDTISTFLTSNCTSQIPVDMLRKRGTAEEKRRQCAVIVR